MIRELTKRPSNLANLDLLLLFFEGCPNTKRARALLESLGIAFNAIEQTALAAQDPMRGYTSPTILFKTSIVYGARTTGASCSTTEFDENELRDRLTLLAKL